MSEQEKKQQHIYDLLNAETKQKVFIWVLLWPLSSPELNPLDYALYKTF